MAGPLAWRSVCGDDGGDRGGCRRGWRFAGVLYESRSDFVMSWIVEAGIAVFHPVVVMCLM